jgi:hypothetical protein
MCVNDTFSVEHQTPPIAFSTDRIVTEIDGWHRRVHSRGVGQRQCTFCTEPIVLKE